MTELRPCPFCGKPALWLKVGGRMVTVDLDVRQAQAFAVTCSDRGDECPVVPHTRWFLSEAMAADEWNRRVRA